MGKSFFLPEPLFPPLHYHCWVRIQLGKASDTYFNKWQVLLCITLSLLSEVCVEFHCFVVVGFLFLTVWSFVCFAVSERMKGFCDFHLKVCFCFHQGVLSPWHMIDFFPFEKMDQVWEAQGHGHAGPQGPVLAMEAPSPLLPIGAAALNCCFNLLK